MWGSIVEIVGARYTAGADPGFPVGGTPTLMRGRQSPTQTLFGENICKNKRIWSCWGARAGNLYVDLPLHWKVRIRTPHRMTHVWSVKSFVKSCRIDCLFLTFKRCSFFVCVNVSQKNMYKSNRFNVLVTFRRVSRMLVGYVCQR